MHNFIKVLKDKLKFEIQHIYVYLCGKRMPTRFVRILNGDVIEVDRNEGMRSR